MQLLTQISKAKFTMYPASSLSASGMLSSTAPNFVQRVAIDAINRTITGTNTDMESKRKRDNYFEEFVATSGMDANLSTADVDQHRKVRFVERMSTAITVGKGESEVLPNFSSTSHETTLDGVNTDNMNDDAIDNMLGRVLMRYLEVCLGKCSTKEELMGEINWSGYAGLSLLHHACFYNFMALITMLINHGADTNILSAEGDLTPSKYRSLIILPSST